MDDALDLFDLLVTDIVRGAHKEGEQTRWRTLHDLDAAALHLWEALQVLLDQKVEAGAIRPQTFFRVSRERLFLAAGAEVQRLTRPPDDNYYAERVERYHSVRRFVPTLWRTVSFEGTQAGQPLLKAVHFLSQLEHQRHPDMQHAPLDGIPSAWRRLVKPSRTTEVDRRAYTLCTLERLQDHLRRRDVFVTRSERWSNPRLKLLHGAHWDNHAVARLSRAESSRVPGACTAHLGPRPGDRLSADGGAFLDQCRGPYRVRARA